MDTAGHHHLIKNHSDHLDALSGCVPVILKTDAVAVC